VRQHHQLKNGFNEPEGFEEQLANCHILLGLLEIILTVARSLIEIGHFLGGQICV
jgi:hypothetical protein